MLELIFIGTQNIEGKIYIKLIQEIFAYVMGLWEHPVLAMKVASQQSG